MYGRQLLFIRVEERHPDDARVPCHEVARIYLDSPSVPDYDSPSERRERLKVPRKVHIGKELDYDIDAAPGNARCLDEVAGFLVVQRVARAIGKDKLSALFSAADPSH